ncbi:hypothetical protein A3D03_06555 [Candidatus Gottesmanbacteria bacterium RIFCSPHIGHO2_02_FULL_40_13]|uniref:PD-(D/E)XK endonuclease-like domain-containing protein n=1 Tax=Candidatus Gottesmanbacteria bacterium RIFCSPHIGHO2_02_FULL_40_13 TaxID=1798384 RepID=A0A1F6A742_9BACT|nr:MAG: hypothetical protein A3D03_06555 [Candidatus Gottesmanbacteria bacterium RIFCSPHIGHO2_02_FULL_40_13]
MYKSSRYIYNPHSQDPFKLSRSKIDLFMQCQTCFYLDRKYGIGRPSMPGFNLNSAVDFLLKREFDLLRADGKPHELMKKYKIDVLPYKHENLDIWRENFKGASYLFEQANFLVTGAIDDIWQNLQGELMIVDYKSTSTQHEISLDDQYKQGYKKQMEVYQWIFRGMGFKVSRTGYFVYANAGRDRDKFDGKLEFALSIIPYQGDDSWIEPTLLAIKKLLDSEQVPQESGNCEYCAYRQKIEDTGKQHRLFD